MTIIACNATMTALLRCVPLPCRLWHAIFSDNTSCSGIIRCQRSYVRCYQNSSVWESQEPSSVCQRHDIIMSLSDKVPYFTGVIDSLDTPARPLSCTAFTASPPLAHGTARS